MEIINPDGRDYHMHSLNYSDGLNTIDELVHWAGVFGLQEIAITDHSQATLDKCNFAKKGFRGTVQTERRWQNVHDNGVNVIFGVEGDLLNEQGDICDHIQGKKGDFLILSLHKEIYSGDFTKVTEAYCQAIERFGQQINVLGHPYVLDSYQQYLDIEAVTRKANEHNIPLELNGVYLLKGKVDFAQLDRMLALADRIYVNSDAHTLHELKNAREAGFAYLRERGYL
ncbi:PHP domain-containing protein [Candidatus Woesearchaeota archaeon]|nr:PHP domain-containing protein [Candidatus Woesearchaeota archaeon]